MKINKNKKGSVMLMTVFIIALMSAVVTGMLQVNTEQLQLLRNQVSAARSEEIAHAGLNDAFAQIREDNNWDEGFNNKSFEDGSYTVTVNGSPPELTVRSESLTSGGFSASVEADITTSATAPHTIRIDRLRINE